MTAKKPNRAITSREVILDTIKYMEFAPHLRTCKWNHSSSERESSCDCGRNELMVKLDKWEKRNE